MDIINPLMIKKRTQLIMLAIVLVVVVLPFIGRFFVIVQAGHTGVQSLFGKVRDTELNSGFHLKNPFMQVTQMSIRTEEYTMSKSQGEGQNLTMMPFVY